jgi:hypothetical protein
MMASHSRRLPPDPLVGHFERLGWGLRGARDDLGLVDLTGPARLGSVVQPPTPSSRWRRFQLITVGFEQPTRRAISLVPIPSAASSTIRAHCAAPARIDGERS